MLSVTLPESKDQIDKIVTVEDLERLFEEMRVAMRTQVVGPECAFPGTGNLDTTRGAILTSDNALLLIRKRSPPRSCQTSS